MKNIPLNLTYIPLTGDNISYLTVKRSWKTLPIARSDIPQNICGFARRVGYTGEQEKDLAIYRLRIKNRPRSITLPGFFVLIEGIFINYDEWQEATKHEEPTS